RTARAVLMPALDVLQSVPILSFLPVVLLGLSAVLPEAFAAEVAAIVLICTSQAWNMTFPFGGIAARRARSEVEYRLRDGGFTLAGKPRPMGGTLAGADVTRPFRLTRAPDDRSLWKIP